MSALLEALATGPARLAELAELLGVAKGTLHGQLVALEREGRARRIEDARGVVRWTLRDEARTPAERAERRTFEPPPKPSQVVPATSRQAFAPRSGSDAPSRAVSSSFRAENQETSRGSGGGFSSSATTKKNETAVTPEDSARACEPLWAIVEELRATRHEVIEELRAIRREQHRPAHRDDDGPSAPPRDAYDEETRLALDEAKRAHAAAVSAGRAEPIRNLVRWEAKLVRDWQTNPGERSGLANDARERHAKAQAERDRVELERVQQATEAQRREEQAALAEQRRRRDWETKHGETWSREGEERIRAKELEQHQEAERRRQAEREAADAAKKAEEAKKLERSSVRRDLYERLPGDVKIKVLEDLEAGKRFAEAVEEEIAKRALASSGAAS